MTDFAKRTWAEINLDAVVSNYFEIKKVVGKENKICCVIKANAYGHGAVELAKIYERLGCDYFAVSNADEALDIRRNGIKTPILILGYTDPEFVNILVENQITQTIYSYDYANQLLNYLSNGKILKIHIKIDTGMNRIGFKSNLESDLKAALDLCNDRRFDIEGIFTHLCCSDEGNSGKAFTESQIKAFDDSINYFKENGVSFKICHCSNSAGIIDYNSLKYDMVRAGIILYGLMPSSNTVNKISLKNVMTLKSVISHLKMIDADESVSYGRTYVSNKKMKIATIPIGYADGFYRSNSNVGYVIVNDCKVKIIGRVCMDQLMVDVTDVQDIKIGDEVILFGHKLLTATDVASINNTINYEVVCSVAERVPRVYISNNKIVDVRNDFLK